MAEENYVGLEEKREQLFKDMKKEMSNGALMAAAIPVSTRVPVSREAYPGVHAYP